VSTFSRMPAKLISLPLSEIHFAKLAALLNGLVPLSLLAWDAWRGELGANPVNYAIRTTGLLALISLMLTLAVTPLAKLCEWLRLTQFRRLLGLYAFAYTTIHFLLFVVFDRGLNLGSTINEIISRVYLQIGTAALLLMLPLAITSSDAMIKRLGPARWKLLHRLTYLIAIAGVTHYYLLVKADVRVPVAFVVVLAGLLFYRIVAHYLKLSRFYAQAKQSPSTSATTIRPQAQGLAKNWSGELKVALLTQETPTVRTIRLVNPDGRPLPFDFLPGQFLTLTLTITGKPIKRPYTIASSPSRIAYCELTIKREEQGLVSRYIHDQIHQGDRIQVTAPSGRFTFDGTEDTALILIGGGVGLTPLMSKIRFLTDRAWDGVIYLIYSARTVDDLIFREELDYLAKRHPNLHVCHTLSQNADDHWNGEEGHITSELLQRYVPILKQAPIHICGPAEFNKSIKQLLLDHEIDPTRIQLESFGPAKRKVATAIEAKMPSSDADISSIEELEPSQENRHEVHFANSNSSISIPAEKTVLEAAEQLGVRIDYDCRAGICGTCKVRLLRGLVQMENQDALDADDLTAGRILACQAHCLEDISIDA
jgi:ferredoxin-NADP reductase/DMSO/TMAO reductase YedYZ heme-binding membrane subunit